MELDLSFLVADLKLPYDLTEAEIYSLLASFSLKDAPQEEMNNYLREDFRRFLYTWSLLDKTAGNLLEIGSNPYYMTLLLKIFTGCNVHCSNFFGDSSPRNGTQYLCRNDENEDIALDYVNFNIEKETVPYDKKFDMILFCEIIEHLTEDPLRALLHIKMALKPGGTLIMTTPNVSRLENVARMLAGANIYDPYSGYGIYGRHNREYNKYELHIVLQHMGFDVEIMFTSDVHSNHANDFFNLDDFIELVRFRKEDLGQYIFIRARNEGDCDMSRLPFLYRSFADKKK